MKPLVIFAAASLAISSSCTIHYNGQAYSNAALSDNNFTNLGRVKGESEARYVLGMGGNDRNALVEAARTNLLQRFPIKDGEVLANFTVDQNTKYRLIFTKVTAHVAADVISFNKDSLQERQSELRTSQSLHSFGPTLIIPEGESTFAVKLGTKLQQVTVDKVHMGNAHYFFEEEDGSQAKGWVTTNELYEVVKKPTHKEQYGFEIGEEVYYRYYASKSGDPVEMKVTIKALNRKKYYVILPDGKRRFLRRKYLEAIVD